MTTNLTTSRPRWELADILHRFQSRYEAKHFVTRHQLILMERIKDCRTAALGGHLEKCNTCDFSRPVYNSCRDRHCPKCQTITKERWPAARKSELLPVPYFHKVFTIPHELNRLTLCNKKVMLNILFSSVSESHRHVHD